jgi:ABC-2 type transport system ATP-binding protein
MSIHVKNINKNYDELIVLKDVNFSIETGEIVGLLGPNGAGKSTLMKILSGLLSSSSGEGQVGGYSISDESIDVRRIIGYLPENNPMYPEMYIKEYLEFSSGFYQIANRQARIDEMIELTGLRNHLSKKIGLLSKGLKQRVGLSQVLLHDPNVLILDEPTSGLDPNQIIEIRNLISSLGKNKTILFSSHIMNEVEALCERVIILDEGRVIADGKTSEISTKTSEISLVSVVFNEDVKKSELLAIENVKNVELSKGNVWLIKSGNGCDIRKNIMSFAVKNDLTILSLNQQSENLESIFQKLTKKS